MVISIDTNGGTRSPAARGARFIVAIGLRSDDPDRTTRNPGVSMIYEDGTYLANNPTWHEEGSPTKAMHIVKMLRNHNIAPQTICDIGCGAGGILECLSKQYDDSIICSGYEISPQAFEFCKQKQSSRLQFFHTNLFDVETKDFDVVLAIDVFEHVEDYMGFLRKLKPKGKYKIFHIPLDLTIRNILLGPRFLNGRYSVGHLHYFTKDTALATLKDTGYEVLDYFYTDHHWEPNYGWRVKTIKLSKEALFRISQDWTVRILGGYSLLVLAR
jgi:hypothetical protein